MPTNISWTLNVDVQSGPKISEAHTVQVDAFDRIEVVVPNTSTDKEIDIQPGASGKVKVLLIRSSIYGDNLKFKVHAAAATDERVLNDVVFLTGKGGMALLEGPTAPLDKLFVTNTTGKNAVLEILVGRSAI